MIKVLIGDMFQSNARTLVNTVNCVGVMGKGIALEFKKRFPVMFKDYSLKCKTKNVKLGKLDFYDDMFNKSVLNFPTKNHWRSPSKLEDIISGLDYFIAHYKEWGIKSIAFPPLGCGNGGLSWKVVGPVMYKKLSPLDIDIEIYAPFGTSNNEITEKFLMGSQVLATKGKGAMAQKLKPEWMVILETIAQLEKQVHLLPVGRVVFQKICYVLTEQGLDTGFYFKQGSYGPFSAEVKNAISAFANANLIREQQLGRMTAIQIGPEYASKKQNFLETIISSQKIIDKTVDLFCRIKNTEQAEEVTTVFYSVIKLKKDNPNVSEENIFDYILDWKPRWNESEKRRSIATTIRNLAMLRWISVVFSEDLPVPEEVF